MSDITDADLEELSKKLINNPATTSDHGSVS